MPQRVSLPFGDLTAGAFGFPQPTSVPHDVQRELVAFASSPDGRRDLADLIDVGLGTAPGVIDQVLWALETGRLTYTARLPSSAVIGPSDHVFELAELAQDEEEELSIHAVVLLLLDTQDRPVVGARYRVIDPDGRSHRGQLDTDGRAEIRDIRSAGACKVSFPEYDNGAWAYVSARPL